MNRFRALRHELLGHIISCLRLAELAEIALENDYFDRLKHNQLGSFSVPLFTRGYVSQLVGGLEHFLFSHILGIIIPIDEL